MDWNGLFQRRATRQILTLTALAEIGVVVTLATGSVLSFGGLQQSYYGFPSAWKIFFLSYPPDINWYAFWSDVLFYVAMGYVVVSAYEGGRGGWARKPPSGFLLAVTFAVWVMVFLAWGRMTYSTTLVGVLIAFLLPLLSLLLWAWTILGLFFPSQRVQVARRRQFIRH